MINQYSGPITVVNHHWIGYLLTHTINLLLHKSGGKLLLAFIICNNRGFASNIFKCIRQDAGRNALKLAITLEKSTFELEAYHHNLHLTHRALDNHCTKIASFKAPGKQPIFTRIMKHTNIHCTRGIISICHQQIKSTSHY